MAAQDGGGETGELPGETIGQRALGGIKTVYGRYSSFRDYLENYTPYAIRTIELVLATVLLFGFLYWLYLFFVVGT